MNINILFPKNYQPDIAKAKVATRLCQAASLYIDLPNSIIIEFTELDNDVYGDSILSANKIRINIKLSVKEIIYPIIHELLHVNQMHKGKLVVYKNKIVWEGKTYSIDQSKLLYEEYRNLPWEQDVANREKILLGKILKTNS
jgi:hypothetical protein